VSPNVVVVDVLLDVITARATVTLTSRSTSPRQGRMGDMDAKECPRCGLVNPAGAGRCDCGYDFGMKSMMRPYGRRGVPPAPGWSEMDGALVTGAGCLLGPALLPLGVIFLPWGLLGRAVRAVEKQANRPRPPGDEDLEQDPDQLHEDPERWRR
jgi:hypothetical protein